MSEPDAGWSAGTEPSPPGELPPAARCDLWVARIGSPQRWLEHLVGEEREHASSLSVDLVQRRYVTSRGLQRFVLGRYLQLPAHAVPITRRCEHCADEGHGRPRLRPGSDGEVDYGEVDYSVSHSGEHVVMAVVAGARVGVDLEVHRRLPDARLLATRVLTAGEQQAYENVPPDGGAREAWLFRAWVRKEAVAKITGKGLALGFERLDVAASDSSCSVVLQGVRQPVRVLDLPAPPGLSAAMAVCGMEGPVGLRWHYLAGRSVPRRM